MKPEQKNNILQLDATIESIGDERYTPAGILVTDIILQHQSQQNEAGAIRQVNLMIKAIAFDDLAYRLRSFDLQTVYRFTGFLTNRGRSQQVVFHITQWQPLGNCSQF